MNRQRESVRSCELQFSLVSFNGISLYRVVDIKKRSAQGYLPRLTA